MHVGTYMYINVRRVAYIYVYTHVGINECLLCYVMFDYVMLCYVGILGEYVFLHYVSMWVCMYARMYVCMYACMYGPMCEYVHMYACLNV